MYPDFSSYNYKIVGELGRNQEEGNITYLATELRDSSEVLLQQFFLDNGGDPGSDQLAIEGKIARLRGLNHPRIPRYLDAFETADGFCLVTEYLPLPSLEEIQGLKTEDIKQIAVSVLEIILDLHDSLPPLLHGKIEPENILIDEALNAYLVNFNIASSGEPSVAAGNRSGETPGLSPHEQLFHLPLTEASDLYSLGATLICLLTGIPSTEIGQLIDNDYRLNFKDRVPNLSPSFVQWLEKMVEPNVSYRYSSAALALSALQPLSVRASLAANNFALPLPLGKSPGDSSGGSPVAIPWKLVAVSFVGTVLGVGMSFGAYSLLCPSMTEGKQPNVASLAEGVEWYRKGRKLAVKKEYKAALEAYDEAIALNPEHANAWANRCWALNKLEQYESALVACDRALEIVPNHSWAMGRKALALFELERLEEALQTLDRSLSIRSRDYWSWGLRGRVQLKLKQYHGAVADFGLPLKINSKDYWSWNNRAIAFNYLYRYEKALSDSKKAIEIDPQIYNSWGVMGNTLNSLGRYDEALAAFDRALAMAPDTYWNWYRRGLAKEKLGRYGEAMSDYQRALQLKPNYPEAKKSRERLFNKI